MEERECARCGCSMLHVFLKIGRWQCRTCSNRPHLHHADPMLVKAYSAWSNMRRRARDGYAGGEVEAAWDCSGGFDAFLGHAGKPATRRDTIDRIDNARGYVVGNVRWVTQAEQNRNTSRNIWIEHDGKRMVLRDWANLTGLAPNTLKFRIRSGWPIAEALTRRPDLTEQKTAMRVTYQGRTRTLSQWGRELGIPRGVLRDRIVDHGWSLERAMTQPVRKIMRRPRAK